MIYGFTHPGSGLGNQLHRYVATRVLALDKGYDFTMIGAPAYFKGKDFMKLDFGETPIPHPMISIENGGKIMMREGVPLWEEKTPYYNPEFSFIEDNTIIDGEFQDERYFAHHLDKLLGWLNIREDLMSGFYDDICIIGFRGGEFYTVPELGLPKSYYDEGIAKMREINPDMVFKVVTDDPPLAKQFFPNFQVGNEIGDDWTSILFGRYAIVANSSFYILPRLLAHHHKFRGEPLTIAPRYWDRYNIKKWERPYNYYKAFQYI